MSEMDNRETPVAAPGRYDKLLPGVGFLLSRSVLYLSLLLLAAAFSWAYLARLEVIVAAPGRVEVEGEPVKVSVPEAGMIEAVAVEPGDAVESGAVLLILDAWRPALDSASIRAEIEQSVKSAEDHRRAAAILRAAAAPLYSELSLARRSAKLIADQLATFQSLSRDRVFSSLEAQEKERELMEAEGRIARLEADIASRMAEAARSEQSAREAEGRAAPLEAKLLMAAENTRRRVVTAPVAGVIARAAAIHPGSVIAPDAEAFTILPAGRPLAAVIFIPNASMRSIRTGLRVRLRCAAFPFQDYGFIEGTLSRIDPAPDAEGKYRALVTLDGVKLSGPKGEGALRVGLALDADIIVERRRVISYLLEPFQKLAAKPPSVAE